MCTRALWSTGDGRVLVGRNMDWLEDMGTDLWALPAGVQREGLVPGGITWTSRYGSVVASSYDITASDGMNQAGLGAHMLWLAEADYGNGAPDGPALPVAAWSQYFLDCFGSVAEAVDSLQRVPVRPVAQVDPNTGKSVTVHLALDDASGDSAIVEYVDGRMRVHHDRAHTVMTNSPPFDQQLEHLARFDGFGGHGPLPGTTEAADRFVRAAYYVRRLPEPGSEREAVAEILSVMRNASQPFGTADPARPNISATIWRTVADLTAGLYFFESSFSPSIIWVHLADLDLSPGQPTRVVRASGAGDDLVGDVTARFEESTPFTFMGTR